MSSGIYGCTKENNICPVKEQCERYMCEDDVVRVTLFKNACNEDNEYELYIKLSEETEQILQTKKTEEIEKIEETTEPTKNKDGD